MTIFVDAAVIEHGSDHRFALRIDIGDAGEGRARVGIAVQCGAKRRQVIGRPDVVLADLSDIASTCEP